MSIMGGHRQPDQPSYQRPAHAEHHGFPALAEQVVLDGRQGRVRGEQDDEQYYRPNNRTSVGHRIEDPADHQRLGQRRERAEDAQQRAEDAQQKSGDDGYPVRTGKLQ